MKILFSSDWHIKLNTKNIPDTWAINRYKILFKELHNLESEVDLHIIGGDIFDKLPSMQELELLFDYLSGCKVETLIYPGNHEALKKDTSFLTHLKSVINGLNPKVQLIDNYYKFYLDGSTLGILPYNKLKDFAQNKPDVLDTCTSIFTHVRGEIPPHVKPEVDLDLFDRWDYVFAGDLHSHSNCQRNLIYPGSPVTTSFHRNLVESGVVIIDTKDNNTSWEWRKLEVPQLLRKTISVQEEMTPGTYDHIIYEVEGDMSDLHLVQESDLIDKKISKRNEDTTLILKPDMTTQEELVEYLEYILQVPKDTIDKVLKEFNDNIKNT